MGIAPDICDSIPINMPKANSQLSDAEKKAKKKLKAELKHQRKVQKLETRIQHAISRNDPIVEQSARNELEELLHLIREYPNLCNFLDNDEPAE